MHLLRILHLIQTKHISDGKTHEKSQMLFDVLIKQENYVLAFSTFFHNFSNDIAINKLNSGHLLQRNVKPTHSFRHLREDVKSSKS